jgi:cytoskeletal protein RodZ
MLEGLSQHIPSSSHWPEENHEEEEEEVELEYLSISEQSLLRRRRLEDVDYWRKRAGWFDDDEAMKEYNSGVYDTYYGLDDDKTRTGGSRKKAAANSKLAKNALIVLAVIIALGLSFLMARVISRRLDGGKEKKKKSSSERSRSRSRSRSKSRSRKEKERGADAPDYDLMEDEEKEERGSRKSSRSKSKSRRSRSRSRTRASSRTKSRKESTSDPVLV